MNGGWDGHLLETDLENFTEIVKGIVCAFIK